MLVARLLCCGLWLQKKAGTDNTQDLSLMDRRRQTVDRRASCLIAATNHFRNERGVVSQNIF